MFKEDSKAKRQSDIWMIYRDPEHLKDGLNFLTGIDPNTGKRNVTYTKDNPIIIYMNLVSKFRVGDKEVERPIGTYLYSKETDTSLMLASARYEDEDLGLISATEEDIIAYFEKENIPYVVVAGTPAEALDNPNIKELWIARDKMVLEDSLKENINNHVDECTYYPNAPVTLSLGYYSDDSYTEVFGFNGKGVILSNFNWTVLVDEGYKDNVTKEEVLEVLNNLGYKYTLEDTPNIDIPKVSR